MCKYDEFADGTCQWKDNFIYASKENEYFRRLNKKYKLDRFITSSEVKTCKNILRWVNEIMLYSELGEYEGKHQAEDIIEYAKGNKKMLNCAMHSIVLTEMLTAIGYKSRSIQCLPFDPIDNDSHFINIVFIQSLNKWIALDPSFSTMFINRKGEHLNLKELREYYIKNITFEVVRYTRFLNNEKFDEVQYKAYLAKNLFRFACIQSSLFTQAYNIIYYLEPRGYRQNNYEKEDEKVSNRFICDRKFFWEN